MPLELIAGTTRETDFPADGGVPGVCNNQPNQPWHPSASGSDTAAASATTTPYPQRLHVNLRMHSTSPSWTSPSFNPSVMNQDVAIGLATIAFIFALCAVAGMSVALHVTIGNHRRGEAGLLTTGPLVVAVVGFMFFLAVFCSACFALVAACGCFESAPTQMQEEEQSLSSNDIVVDVIAVPPAPPFENLGVEISLSGAGNDQNSTEESSLQQAPAVTVRAVPSSGGLSVIWKDDQIVQIGGFKLAKWSHFARSDTPMTVNGVIAMVCGVLPPLCPSCSSTPTRPRNGACEGSSQVTPSSFPMIHCRLLRSKEKSHEGYPRITVNSHTSTCELFLPEYVTDISATILASLPKPRFKLFNISFRAPAVQQTVVGSDFEPLDIGLGLGLAFHINPMVIRYVSPDSPVAGHLLEGDYVLEINNQKVASASLRTITQAFTRLAADHDATHGRQQRVGAHQVLAGGLEPDMIRMVVVRGMLEYMPRLHAALAPHRRHCNTDV